MKKKILLTALAQISLAMVLGVGLVLFRTFESIEGIEWTARLYAVCAIVGGTGILTGCLGAVFPKDL